ncbi:MAG: hypothetical protein AB1894_22095 [Chloroflexota bacterium]
MKSTRLNILLRLGGSLLAAYILWRAGKEFFVLAPAIGSWWGKLSTKWAAGFLGFLGLHICFLAIWLLALWLPSRFSQVEEIIARRIKALGRLRLPLAIAIVLLSTWFLLFTDLGGTFTGPYLRLSFLIDASLLIAALITPSGAHTGPADQLTDQPVRIVTPANLAFAIVLTGTFFYIAGLLTNVTDYPFMLSWSEGNRFYDYSTQVDPQRYQYGGQLTTTYNSPGRHILWGIPFYIPNSPIWFHRLWDALLWIIPYLIFGCQLARWSQLDQSKIHRARWIICLWVYLFLAQGPIYPPLLLGAILIVALVGSNTTPLAGKAASRRPGAVIVKWGLAIAAAALAGYYASSSRWTWLPASAAWAVIILLAGFQFETNGPRRWQQVLRLFPIALVGLAALAGGALANPKLLSPKSVAGSTALSQPLLWSRLFPNVTYPDGIVIGLALAALPLIILLVWLALSRRWPVNWLQALGYFTASLAFLALGIVASVKIGGGNNLHNLDMFLITLALLAGLALRQIKPGTLEKRPTWISGILALALILPAWNAMKDAKPLQLPAPEATERALSQVASYVKKAQKKGEILFIDQRQLLTFGYLKNIDLIPEYEKKYMMDKAMAGDAAYFEQFYSDLASQRFQLIVSEPLVTRAKGTRFSFNEENNAWVFWVSRPLLCYYTPILTLDETKIQLLAPRDDPENCP